MNQRDTALDIIRLLDCFMVVLMHSPMPLVNANGPFLAAMSYFMAPCIGLFFMVSGALLLPVKTDYFTFLRRRFGKISPPYSRLEPDLHSITSVLQRIGNRYFASNSINTILCSR